MGREITLEIYPEEETIYITEENTSGASYKYHDLDDIGDIIKEYLKTY